MKITIGDDLSVERLGFGAMQLTGPGVWGQPADRPSAIRLLQHAVDLGVQFIDTADSYGPDVNEELIRDALHPYADGLVVATKAGLTRPGPDEWAPNGRPDHLRRQCESSLTRLRVERIDLFQLHRIDPSVNKDDQIGELFALQAEGKIRHVGLSEVSADELDAACSIGPIVSVQNLYNLGHRTAEPVIRRAEQLGVAFIPWCPLGTGAFAGPGGPADRIAQRLRIPPAAMALAWLLQRSPAMLPIPGTSSMAHLEENMTARLYTLAPADVSELDALTSASLLQRARRRLALRSR